jgi:Ca2+-binding RTX toxin-like protein
MKIKNLVGVRQFSVVSAAALAVGIGAVGAGAAPSYGSTPPEHTAAPSSVSAAVANDTLTITGTNGPDNISIALANGDPNTLTVDLDNNGVVDQHFDRSTFSAIAVFLNSGDDQFAVVGTSPDEPITVDGGRGDDNITTGSANDLIFGGSGRDTVNSGAGDDVIDAGSGDDFVVGGIGHDTALLGSGRDTFVWNPGEGSDFVAGDSGTDTLVFNGAAVPEQMSLSANGTRSVFLRSPGNVRMDMDGVEQLNLTPLGGADTVAINDMTGTGFDRANIDLSAAGAGDSAIDNVTVNGTAGADHVRVDADHARVDVEGLQTETRITGSEPTDHLQVNTLDGNDKVRVDNDVLPLIGTNVDLGAGQH